MKIGERLKELRNHRHWTQEQLADLLFVTKQAISGWERNIAIPSIKQLTQIADLFHVSTDYLLGRSCNPELPNNLGKVNSPPIYDLEQFLFTNDWVNIDNHKLTHNEKCLVLDILRRILKEFAEDKGIDRVKRL